MTILVNDKAIKNFNFSGGEVYVQIDKENIKDTNQILAKLESSDDIMQLLLSVNAIRNINSDAKIELTIPYFPYARQDRVCNEGEAFSLEVMAGLINQLNLDKVIIFDPHSQVTPNLIRNCEFLTLEMLVSHSNLAQIIKDKGLTLISPDKGAKDKILAVGKSINQTVFSAHKVRDPKTGQIIDSQLEDDVKGLDCIVMDDICDGGATFIELAKLLKNKGANKIYLYVTHGIFSKGFAELQKYFEHCYCVNPLHNVDQKDDTGFLSVIELN